MTCDTPTPTLGSAGVPRHKIRDRDRQGCEFALGTMMRFAPAKGALTAHQQAGRAIAVMICGGSAKHHVRNPIFVSHRFDFASYP